MVPLHFGFFLSLVRRHETMSSDPLTQQDHPDERLISLFVQEGMVIILRSRPNEKLLVLSVSNYE